MRLVVTDANILIDLAAGDLLEEMFRLPDIEFSMPDVLYMEECAQRYGMLPGLGMKILPLSAEAVEYVTQLRERYRGPSTNDLFALALARTLGCALLSGDHSLRAAADTEGVEIHGTLWLIEALLKGRLVLAERVSAAYEAMRQDGSRLPWDEVQDQIRRWQDNALPPD